MPLTDNTIDPYKTAMHKLQTTTKILRQQDYVMIICTGRMS